LRLIIALLRIEHRIVVSTSEIYSVVRRNIRYRCCYCVYAFWNVLLHTFEKNNKGKQRYM